VKALYTLLGSGLCPRDAGAHATDDPPRAVLEVKSWPRTSTQEATPQQFRCGLQRRRSCAQNVTGPDGD
jgi:hypothetical protein